MNNDLNKRIDEVLMGLDFTCPYAQVMRNCRAEIQRLEALREYVPMTDDGILKIQKRWLTDLGKTIDNKGVSKPDLIRYLESAFIKRAGLRIKDNNNG